MEEGADRLEGIQSREEVMKESEQREQRDEKMSLGFGKVGVRDRAVVVMATSFGDVPLVRLNQ